MCDLRPGFAGRRFSERLVRFDQLRPARHIVREVGDLHEARLRGHDADLDICFVFRVVMCNLFVMFYVYLLYVVCLGTMRTLICVSGQMRSSSRQASSRKVDTM